jgi:hypothetical protein
VGKHSIDEWYSIRLSDVRWKVNKNLNGVELSAHKKRYPGHVNKLPVKNPLPANVPNDSAVPATAMDLTIIHSDPIHAHANPNKLNHPHLNACQPRLRQVILRAWNQQRQDYRRDHCEEFDYSRRIRQGEVYFVG